jgi:cellulose synthase/poly-beta-1,6-N-acetylglucosamine synthase-like glycosyltransferase
VTYLFYIFAALLIWLSYKSFRGGIDYLNYFKQELARPRSEFEPFVTIFAPCKGIDQGMQNNFDALLQQDFPEYEVVFIVDDGNDAAAGVIESAWREAEGRHVKLVVAPIASDSSQKVQNLREGVLHADPQSEVFVFVDSDARPSPDWLRNLIAPLTDDRVGAATGYRWFISQRPTIASEMRNAWNASIASALGPNRKTNFCWGGSTAIQREVFERLNIRERWHGTLSDDFTITRAMHDAGLDIYFVPQALTPSIEDCTFRKLIEFTTRQMKITRVYSAKLWALSFFGSAVFTGVMVTAILIVILSARRDLTVSVAIVTLVAVSILSIGKSWLRMKAVRLVLPQYQPYLRSQMFPQMSLWLVTPVLFLANCAAALLSRRVTWRGKTYEMTSSNETRVQ